jgi:hypothetical protein
MTKRLHALITLALGLSLISATWMMAQVSGSGITVAGALTKSHESGVQGERSPHARRPQPIPETQLTSHGEAKQKAGSVTKGIRS